MSPLRFTFLFGIYAGIIGLAAAVLNQNFDHTLLIPKFWVIFGALAVVTWMAYVFSWIGIKRGAEFSIYSIMGAVVVKLLLSMAFALVYILRINVDKVTFVIDFMSIYFLFSGFEMWGLLTNLRHQNKSE